jgi:hypothetical protein
MACFLVSAAEAALVTAAAKAVEKKEHAQETEEAALGSTVEHAYHVPFSRKLKWLSNMLWGGSVLLLFEHLWHGEIVPWFPFLTAAADPADTAEMLKEMATVGVAMAALVTTVWLGMVAVTALIEKRAAGDEPKTAPAEE